MMQGEGTVCRDDRRHLRQHPDAGCCVLASLLYNSATEINKPASGLIVVHDCSSSKHSSLWPGAAAETRKCCTSSSNRTI